MKTVSLALAAAGLAVAAPASAGLVTFSTTGTIIDLLDFESEPTGPSAAATPGIAAGDVVTFTATYDDANVIVNGIEKFIEINAEDESFEISSGSILVNQTGESLNIDSFLYFQNGNFVNFFAGVYMEDGSFYVSFPRAIVTPDGRMLGLTEFLIGKNLFGCAECGGDGGEFDDRAAALTPVPEPEIVVALGEWGTSAVPEPATWAMLIAGFGLVGGMLRRRRPLAA